MKKIDMLHGSLADKILLFALPIAASSILQQLFNSADVAVVGRFAGSEALAAVGGNASVISLMINLFIGISIGANVLIATLIGQGQTDKVQDVVHTVITMSLISGIFLLIAGQVIARPILILMNTPDDVLDLAVLYLKIYFAGMPFFMLYNFGAAVLRSVGDTRRPLYCLILSGIINVCLNLFLVIVLDLSVAGVGIATVTSNGVSAFLVLWFLLHEEAMLRVDLKKLSLKKEYVVRILKIGVPAGVQSMVFSLSNVCIQTAVNSFGSAAIAGSSAAVNFEYFTYYMTNSFAQAATTFSSQNYGAGLYDRCKKIMKRCIVFGLICSGTMSVCFVLGREIILSLYTVDPVVMEYAVQRVLLVETLAILPVFYEVTGGILRGMGHSLLPAVITLLGSCALRFAWVYTVFAWIGTYDVLLYVYPVTWIVTSIAMLSSYFILKKKIY